MHDVRMIRCQGEDVSEIVTKESRELIEQS
jgi:hypothetical protein